MAITRRALFFGLAAVAAAAATGIRISERERRLLSVYRWANADISAAIEAEDYSDWVRGGEEADYPKRARLARAYVELRELSDPTALETVLRDQVTELWYSLIRWREESSTFYWPLFPADERYLSASHVAFHRRLVRDLAAT